MEFGLYILNLGLSSRISTKILIPFLPTSQGSLRYIKSSLLWISVSPHYSYFETLISSMVVFGIRKQLYLNEVIRVGSWSNRFSVLLRRIRRELTHALSLYPHSGKDKVDISKSGREPSPELTLPDLDLGHLSSRIMRKLVISSSVWYFVMAAWPD